MSLFEALFLGVLQGLTEFVPVSSSGHLVLAETYMGLEVKELVLFDVVLHAGTLLALVLVFWGKILEILRGDWGFFAKLVVATLPAAVVGVLFKDYLEEFLRFPKTVAVSFIIMGLVYLVAERMKRDKRGWGWGRVVGMGLAQAVALVPGVSRSGATVAMGEFLGMERRAAAEAAFLMLLPVVAGALGLVFLGGDWEGWQGGYLVLGVGFLASAVSSFVVAKAMLNFFRRFGLNVFAGYLLLVGVVILFAQ